MLIQKAVMPLGMKNESELSAYFADIFMHAKSADGAVCLFSDKNHAKNISYTKASEMHLRGPRELSRHDRRDAMFTFATFHEKQEMNRTLSNVSNVFAWSVDVDYTRTDLSPEDVFWHIMDVAGIPAPNYIEYGHRLRLIYLLEEPLRLIPGRKGTLLRGYSFMQKCVAGMINNAVSWAGAESCPVTSFFRVPGSFNTKTGAKIAVKHVTDERWTMQEIFDNWIPEDMIDKSGNASEWKSQWKQKRKSGRKVSSWNNRALWQRRMSQFEEMRNDLGIPREKLCFLYGISCLQTGQANTSEEAVQSILLFNREFSSPLSEKEIQSKFRTIRPYSFKDSTIADFLGTEYGSSFSRKSYDADRYKQKRAEQIENGDTKEQKISMRRNKVALLLQKGLSASSIATKLDISLATAKRDLAYLKQSESALSKQDNMQGTYTTQGASVSKAARSTPLSLRTSCVPAEYADKYGVVGSDKQCQLVQTTDVICYKQPDVVSETARRFVTKESSELYSKESTDAVDTYNIAHLNTEPVLIAIHRSTVHQIKEKSDVYQYNVPAYFSAYACKIDNYIQLKKNEPGSFTEENTNLLGRNKKEPPLPRSKLGA